MKIRCCALNLKPSGACKHDLQKQVLQVVDAIAILNYLSTPYFTYLGLFISAMLIVAPSVRGVEV